MTSERITVAVRRVNSRVALAFLLLFLFSPSLFARRSPWGPESFRTISFSGECLRKTWSLTPDNALAVILAPGLQSACVADLTFHTPQSLETVTSFLFEVRGSGRKPKYRLEFVEKPSTTEDDVARTSNLLAPRDWDPDGLRFDHLREGKIPTKISVLRIVAVPNGRVGSTGPVLYLRNFRLAGNALKEKAVEKEPFVAEKPTRLPALPVMKPPFVLEKTNTRMQDYFLTVAVYLSRLSKMHWHITRAQSGTALGLLSLWILGALYFTRRPKPLHATAFGPLYEMNTRIWKSERDADGVLHVGGFSKITSSDLRDIKAAGFHSIWFMGTWAIGDKVRAISKRYGNDYAGSPFAISDYQISDELGGEASFKELVERAHAAGLKVILDFIPNHMGLDCVWLNEHPEFFIHRVLDPIEASLPDADLEGRYPGHFIYRTPSYPENGRRVPKTILVAYGKDPHFYPWIDTAQLDYADPALRRKMIDVLTRVARLVDGVRCDMAMLVLREQVKIHRHPEMSWEVFNRWMPEEFWSEAIRTVKRINPLFTFIAETYWAMEGYLQHLGFDYTYNKPLYEAICGAFHSGHAEGLLNFIRMLGTDFLRKGVHFLENHDEERAMNALGLDRQKGAAVLLCTLPGVALLHQGQMEGKRERLPVQRVVPLHEETEQPGLSAFYKRLLAVTQAPLFREGRLHVLYSNNASFISFARVEGDQRAVVVINTSNRLQKGMVSLVPALRLKTGHPYRFDDLFYNLKASELRRQPGVQSSYEYPAAQLINQGLYVELGPFDAHIFRVEAMGAYHVKEGVQKVLRHINEELPLPRVARRLLGPALLRSSDEHPH